MRHWLLLGAVGAAGVLACLVHGPVPAKHEKGEPAVKTPLTFGRARDAFNAAFVELHSRAPTYNEELILLAQAAHETGNFQQMWGYNWGGLKGKGDAGTQLLWTTEVVSGESVRMKEPFRRYSSAERGAYDWLELLSKNELAMVEAANGNSDAFVAALKARKYFTDSLHKYQAAVRALVARTESLLTGVDIVSAALNELATWEGVDETSPLGLERIRHYWASAGQSFPGPGTPWSAAFIVALDPSLPPTGYHMGYLAKVTNGSVPGWRRLKPDETLVPGDIVVKSRADILPSESDISSGKELPTHGDVVISVDGGVAAVGGNVKNSVSETHWPGVVTLADGPWFAGIRKVKNGQNA